MGSEEMIGKPPQGDWLGTQFLRLERHGSMARCTVDRPASRNAMTPAMYFGVRRAVDVVSQDDGLAGLMITGTGDVFIPGGELGGKFEDSWGDLSGLLSMDNVPFEAIRNARKPVVSAINGICQGGGLLIAMLSDVAVASERATFRAPELLRGIADMGYAAYLPEQVGIARARDMLMTGRTLSAQEALDWGLVTRVVEHDQLEAEASEVLRQCCWGAPRARNTVKHAINARYGRPDRAAMEASLEEGEAREGFAAFKERRAPDWIPEDLRPKGRL